MFLRRISIGACTSVGAIPALLGIVVAAGCASPVQDRFLAHIDYLASDELEGRGVGTPGIELAAEYIAQQFAEIGLEPVGKDDTFFQSFPLALRRTLTDECRLAFDGAQGELTPQRDYIPFSFSSSEEFSGKVVFCGYGIEATDKQWDDFVHTDITGKVVLFLRGEPPSWSDADGYTTSHSMFRNKVYNAKDRSAVAVLIVNQQPTEGEDDTLMAFATDSADNYGIPAFHVSRTVADKMLAEAGKDSLDTLQEKLDAGEFSTTALPGIKASGTAGLKQETAPTRNVLGLLRGSGPLSDEVVVIGAHYDHLGIRQPRMRVFKEGKRVHQEFPPAIHNGADDNASGVSGIIEIARMFAEGPPTKRSILFVAFTGEEAGLHGSKHYVEDPPIPLSETVCMINLDMIGRLATDTKKVQVFGAGSAAELTDMVNKAAETSGLSVIPGASAGGRSDHAPFVRNKVPAMHFFTGQHSDYHKPTDDTDKINARGGVKVVRLIHRVASQVANHPTHLTFQEGSLKSSTPSGGTPTYRVVMGIAPGYVDDGGTGMSVDGVTAEGPADLAGLKAGDRIIQIGDKKIANIYDYMASTRKNNPGDTVEVVVIRDGKELTLHVTLAAAS